MLRKRENFKRKRLRKPDNGKAYKMQQVVADFFENLHHKFIPGVTRSQTFGILLRY